MTWSLYSQLCCYGEGKITEREVKMQSDFQISPTKTGLTFLKHWIFRSKVNTAELLCLRLQVQKWLVHFG